MKGMDRCCERIDKGLGEDARGMMESGCNGIFVYVGGVNRVDLD